jgi:CspA family cold shock protein
VTDTRQTGTVKFFSDERGFGFIKLDDGSADIFVHARDLQRSGLQTLQDGERVSFATQPSRTGKSSPATL